MVHEIKDPKLSDRLKRLALTPFFIPVVLLFFFVLTIPVITLITSQRQDIRQHAAAGIPTASMNITPPSGNYSVGQALSVDFVIDGGGQAFNAAQADIAISSNLTVQSVVVTPPASGGCNFTYVNNRKTPTIADPSFAGAILNGSSTHCTLFSITLLTNAVGTGSVTLSKTSVKSYTSHNDILATFQNGSYLIGVVVTPTPTSTPTPIPTTIPSATPTAIPPTSTPTPSPTPLVLTPPSINAQPTNTYKTSIVLDGSKTNSITQVFVNNATAGVTYPTTSTWSLSVALVVGTNNFVVYGKDILGNSSLSTGISIQLHRLGDISGDSIIDLTDLSIFGTDWENVGILNNPLSDMNGDGVIDLTDFSILATAYGN